MKSVLFSLLALALLPSAFAQTCGEEEVAAARIAQNEFEAGLVSRTEVAKADLTALRALHNCGTLPNVDYCEKSLVAAEIVYLGVSEEARLGLRSAKDVANAKAVRADLRKACN